MTTTGALGRARNDLDVMSRAGLPLHRFLDESALAMQRAIPFVAACMSTMDPATAMVSSGIKVGALAGRNDEDAAWARIEYGVDDPTAMAAIAASGRVAIAMHAELSGALDRSVRMAELMMPRFGFTDEARVVLTDRGATWGGISLFRGENDPFSAEEVAFLAAVAPAFARGIRGGLLAQTSRTDAGGTGPAVVVVDAGDRIVQSSPGATPQLQRISAVPNRYDPLTLVHALVSAARRYAGGEADRMPRVRIRTADGVWLVLHAAPLAGTGDRVGDVVVTIEEARPQEVIGIVAAAFGLTARERDVVGMVLRGADTKEIAGAMHVSPCTVQDHLKSIFDKAGVASRRELVARVYFEQYAPRWGEPVGADGWFAG